MDRKNIDILCQQIRDEFRRNKRHHLRVALLLLELKGKFEKERDFIAKCQEEFGLAERTAYQYVEVARKTYVHHLDLDFSKLYLLSRLSEKELKIFLRRSTPKKLAKVSVRVLEDALKASQNKEKKKKAQVLHPIVSLATSRHETSKAELKGEELRVAEDFRAVIENVRDLPVVSNALKTELEAYMKEMRGVLESGEYNWLTRNNRKMLKMSGAPVFTWGIPAYRTIDGIETCPNAAACATGCFAVNGIYRFSNIAAVFEKRFRLSLTERFADVIDAEIKRRDIQRVRLHDSGDFYNEKYLQNWIEIMRHNPTVEFYTYTKMVSLFKRYDAEGKLPENFKWVLSYGGKEDRLIDKEHDRHSIVFDSVEELEAAGYVDAHVDDSTVLLTPSFKIGLVYHGTKKLTSTNWQKVPALKEAA